MKLGFAHYSVLAVSTLVLAASEVGASQVSAKPWQTMDYVTGARCVWLTGRDKVVGPLEEELKGPTSNVPTTEIDRCADLRQRANRPYDRKAFVNFVVLQAYQYASRCALKASLNGVGLAWLQEQWAAFQKDRDGYQLPENVRVGFATCDDRALQWYDRQLSTKQVLANLIDARIFFDQIVSWKIDPARRSDASQLTVCIMEDAEWSAADFWVDVLSQSGDKRLERAAALLPELAAGCRNRFPKLPPPDAVLANFHDFFRSLRAGPRAV